MRRSLAVVYSKSGRAKASLHGWVSEPEPKPYEIELESEAWFGWLGQRQSFRLTYWPAGGGEVHVTIRAEQRRSRTYWQGWKTIRGQTPKKYIGSSAGLTKAKLDEVGVWFSQLAQTQAEADPSARLYAAAVDLVWWAERLIEGCPDPGLAQRASQALTELKQQLRA
jgi:hypothetical protein